MNGYLRIAVLSCSLLAGIARAAEPVVPAKDQDALFRSSDPTLHANKQVVYHILKDLIQAGHWDQAEKYMSERYIQHNPNLNSGREGMAGMMARVVKPRAIPEKLQGKIVAVTAEKDLVVVATAIRVADPTTPGKSYTTTQFDMWRIKDGKADEHWDSALLGPPLDLDSPPPPSEGRASKAR